MTHYTVPYKYGKRARIFFAAISVVSYFIISIWGRFKKTIIPLTHVGYEMIMNNLLSNVRSWNNR